MLFRSNAIYRFHFLAEMGLMRTQQEVEAVNRVLDAAAFTYVAAFITSLSLLLYYFLALSGRRN